MTDFIFHNRHYFTLAEIILMPTGVLLLTSYILILVFRKERPKITALVPRIGSTMIMIALGLQVIVRSAEGDILLTALAFVTLCYVLWTFHYRIKRQ